MADDLSKRDFRDKTRINTKQRHEMVYWRKRFGVSGQQIAGAVRTVGAAYLKSK